MHTPAPSTYVPAHTDTRAALFKNNKRAPLLMIAGEHDHIVPAHVAKSNFEHYKQSSARTDFHEFKGRAHLLIAQDGWEEIADDVISWLEQLS